MSGAALESRRRRRARLVGAALLVLAWTVAARGQDRGAARRIFHLDSYHRGDPVSDGTEEGIQSVLAGKPVELTTFYLDAKRRKGEADIRASVEKARAAIAQFKPDLLIASDDPAVKYVVVPFFKDGPLPVVYCGVNWSSEAYGLPNANATGMIEISPILEALDLTRKSYRLLRRLGVLAEDSLSEQTNRAFLESRYRAQGFDVTYVMVKDYTTWKREFARLQDVVDVLYLPNLSALHDAADARAFVLESSRKPSIATEESMMPFAMLGFVKLHAEQGEFAAQAALKILAGTKPSQIPPGRNRRRKVFLNRPLAKKIGFTPGPELEGARVVE